MSIIPNTPLLNMDKIINSMSMIRSVNTAKPKGESMYTIGYAVHMTVKYFSNTLYFPFTRKGPQIIYKTPSTVITPTL